MQNILLQLNYIKLFVIALIIIGCSAYVFALDPKKSTTQYLVKSWQDQFPQNTIITLTQTNDGYIWFGTFEGLVRFDGVRFVSFNINNSALPHKSVMSLVPDGKDLWIGTIRGLSHFKDGKFTNYFSKDGLVNESVHSLHKDKKGNLWVGTTNGLSLFKDGKFTNYKTEDGLASNFVTSIKEDSSEKLWIGTSDGLSLLENGKLRVFGLKDHFVYDILEDKEGKDNITWFATTKGLVKLQNQQFTTYTTKDGLTSDGVRQVKKDRDGNLWLGTLAGLNRFTNGKFTNLNSYQELSSEDIVISILEDIEGNLWAGSHRGLICIKNGKFFPITTRDGLSNNYVRTMLGSSKGGLWVGTGAGLNYLDPSGKITIFTTKDGLSMANIRALYEDKNGVLWVGTEGGLNQFKDGKFTIYTTKDGLASNTIYAILEDGEGALWIGTYGEGLSKFKDGKFTNYTTKDGLLSNIVRTLFLDDDKTLWVGTQGGVNQIKDGKITSPTSEISKRQVFAFLKDSNANLWIGTGEGLLKYKDGKFSLYTSKDGLFDDLSFCILEDSDNTLWLSSSKGIYSIKKSEFENYDKKLSQTIKGKNYDKFDGMLSNQCNGANQPAGWKTNEGKLFFPTINGVIAIDPKDIKSNENIPSVKIEDFQVDGQSLPFYKQTPLSYDKEKFKFYFTGLSFIAPEKVKFKYKLEGFDKDWSKEDFIREVSYTNLPAGRYTFKVIACNNDGLWNEVGDSYNFSILPPWWKTWWAYGSYFLVSSLTVLGIVRFQTEKVKQKARVALLKEKERSILRETQLRAETAEIRAKSIEVENAKKAEELAYARQLQLSMLPKENIQLDNIEIIGHMRTATEVGGDYYDFIKMGENSYFLVIGDVTGHGVGAGLVVGMVKALLVNIVNSLRKEDFRLTSKNITSKTIASINSSLNYLLTKKGIGIGLTIAIFDSNKMTVEICSNGMPYPCLYKNQSKQIEVIELKGPPLGFLKEINPKSKTLKLELGDKLLFISDGFSERMNKENKIWGYQKTVTQFQHICSENPQTQNIVENLNVACDDFASGIPNHDDMTLLILNIKENVLSNKILTKV